MIAPGVTALQAIAPEDKYPREKLSPTRKLRTEKLFLPPTRHFDFLNSILKDIYICFVSWTYSFCFLTCGLKCKSTYLDKLAEVRLDDISLIS